MYKRQSYGWAVAQYVPAVVIYSLSPPVDATSILDLTYVQESRYIFASNPLRVCFGRREKRGTMDEATSAQRAGAMEL